MIIFIVFVLHTGSTFYTHTYERYGILHPYYYHVECRKCKEVDLVTATSLYITRGYNVMGQLPLTFRDL